METSRECAQESTKPRLLAGISWANRRKDSIGFVFFHQTCIQWKARRRCGALSLFVLHTLFTGDVRTLFGVLDRMAEG